MKFAKGNYTFLILSAALAALLLSFADEWTNKFREDYRIYSLPIPDKTTFAGEEIALTDEDVRERYDRELLTNTYWQSQTLLMLKRGQKIFPVIEPILKCNNIPDDFKYLAVAESGLQPLVVSPAGAASYWQFLDKTGKVFGLTVTEEVDERYHLEKATEAACKYFRQAYNAFGSWKLVAASYNMGIEGVKRQINQQRVGNYEDLYLNQETARYLFRIVAIKTIFENPKAYGFHLAPAHSYQREALTIIAVDRTIDNLVSFASGYGCNYKDLKYYNPWLRKPTLTVNTGQVFYIALPKKKVRKVIDTPADTLFAAPPIESEKLEFEHTIEQGESLQTIAEKYNVPVGELKKWNNLATDKLKPGATLKIKKQLME
jgi:hypothetical protein